MGHFGTSIDSSSTHPSHGAVPAGINARRDLAIDGAVKEGGPFISACNVRDHAEGQQREWMSDSS
jgi:hypothetical protein